MTYPKLTRKEKMLVNAYTHIAKAELGGNPYWESPTFQLQASSYRRMIKNLQEMEDDDFRNS